MSMLVRYGLAALAIALPVAGGTAAASDSVRQETSPEQDRQTQAALVEQGRALYAHRCSHCHGFNMVSAGTVTYDLRSFPRDQEDRFLESVVNGKNDRMPPWGDVLSLDEIEAIWAYVLSRGK
jgi:mono/diheme cytochrome c family protein